MRRLCNWLHFDEAMRLWRAGQPAWSWPWRVQQRWLVLAWGVCVVTSAVAVAGAYFAWTQLQAAHALLAQHVQSQRQQLDKGAQLATELAQQVQPLPPVMQRPSAIQWRHIEGLEVAPLGSPSASTMKPTSVWRFQAQGNVTQLARVWTQFVSACPLGAMTEFEVLRMAAAPAQPATWQMVWVLDSLDAASTCPAAAQPLASVSSTKELASALALLSGDAFRQSWVQQLERQPGRALWLAPELSRPLDVLETVDLAALAYVGWVIEAEQRHALVRHGTQIHMLAPGRYLGRDHGRLHSVHPEHLWLREIARDPQGRWGPRWTQLPLAGQPADASRLPSIAKPPHHESRP